MDPKRLALGSAKIAPKRQGKRKSLCNRTKKRFLKGPISWAWLSLAAIASGRGAGFKVAIVLWQLFGLNQNENPIKLSTKRLRELGVERHAAYRGLKVLEKAGLVTVQRLPGQNSMVTICDVGEM